MKKLLVILLAALLALFSLSALAEDDFDYEDGNPPLAPEISLAANPSTGYQWRFEVDDPCVEVTDHGFYEGDTELLGAGGTQGFRLNGAEAGYAEIEFTYARSWTDAPQHTLIYRVIVTEDLDVMIYEVVMQ